MTVTEIIEALTPYTGRFPKAAVEAAMAQREEVTPHLLRTLEEVAEAPEKFTSQKYMLHLFATYLLAQFREKRAYRPLTKILAAPGDIPDKLFGDTLGERLGNILASIYDGDPKPVKELVEGEKVDEFVRGAAVGTFIVLAHTGQITRQEVVDYYRDLFHGKLPREHSQVWNELACAVADLPAPELLGDLRKAFDDNLVNPWYADLEGLERDALVPFEQKQKLHPEKLELVSDTISEMDWWCAFNEDGDKPTPEFEDEMPAPPPVNYAPPQVTFHRETPKIGRNDPCPCGSGKKHKKCCLGKS